MYALNDNACDTRNRIGSILRIRNIVIRYQRFYTKKSRCYLEYEKFDNSNYMENRFNIYVTLALENRLKGGYKCGSGQTLLLKVAMLRNGGFQ